MLSELQKRKLMNQFRSNDRDRDGQIERSEMLAGHQDLLARKGWQPTMPEYKAYMASIEGYFDQLLATVDVNKDGKISADEFLMFYAAMIIPVGGDFAKIPASFDQVTDAAVFVTDVDGDGRISLADYRSSMESFRMGDFDATAAFSAMDLDGDGYISREQVATLVREFYFSNDAAAPGNMLWGPF